jgi:hypothetical protein
MPGAENRVRGRVRASGEVRTLARVVALAACALAACSCSGTPEGSNGTRSPFEGPGAPGERDIGRIGNQASGIDAMPDWDAAARRVHDDVAPRLPDPLPPVGDACTGMLDAARRFYVDTEGERSRAVEAIEAARTADERACAAETSAAAAACVTILLGESAGEYPWLLDQCTRAFPKA